jgi:mono/diheme cytochrome c family protein
MKRSLLSALVVASTVAAAIGATSQTVPYDPERAGYMRAHLGDAMLVHAAVIRGELAAAAAAARKLASAEDPKPLPPGSAPHLAVFRKAAQKAADAKDIVAAADATAEMLVACGECHRAAGTMPPTPSVAWKMTGGVVGHMYDHREGADQLLHGLVIPSTTLWQAGAKALASPSPARFQDLAVSARKRRQMTNADEQLHQTARLAFQASEPHARASLYSRMLATCADCHTRIAPAPGPQPW